MARQPIQDLQGYGEVSKPSATPVDTYTGTVAAPKQSSAMQLADALGSVANQGAKIVAQRKAEAKQEELEMAFKRASIYAQNFQPTKDNPSLDTNELHEKYPALKFSVLATIIEDKNTQAYETATRKKLNSLPKEVRLDPEKLQQAYNGLIIQASKETEGQDFVNSGALSGVNKAYRAVQNEWASQTQLFAEGEHKNNFEGNVYNIFDGKDLSTPEGMQAAIEGIQTQETKHRGTDELEGTSPLGKKGDKQLWLDNLLTYAKNNPKKGQNVLDTVTKITWLQDSNTKGWLDNAREEVTDLAIADLELDQAQLKVQLAGKETELEVEIDNLLVEGKRDEVRQILSKTIPTDATELTQQSALYAKKYARVALARENADPEASNLRLNEFIEDIKTASSTGNWSGMGFTEPPNNDQLRKLIGKDEALTQQDAAVLRNNLSDLRKGFTSISPEALARDVGTKFSLDLQYFNTETPKALLGAAGMSAQRVMEDAYSASMQEQFTDFYNNPNYKTGVPEGDVLKAMKATAFAEVEAAVTKLNTVLTAEGNKIENLKGFNQELSQGEQPSENGGDSNLRPDGTVKSQQGFLGQIPNNVTGEVMTEASMGVTINGNEVLIPTLVPTLTQDEVAQLANMQLEGNAKNIPASIKKKAVDHAVQRISSGKDPFYQDGEEEAIQVGDILRDDNGNPVATYIGGNPEDDSSYEAYVTDEDIEKFRDSSNKAEDMLEGLSPKAIREAYGDDIRSYIEMVGNRETNEESILDFFTDKLPDYFKESFDRQERVNKLTRQEKLIYEKTGKFPEDFE